MIYMSKILPLIFLLSSCGAIGLQELPIIASQIYDFEKNNTLDVTKEFYNTKKFSFIKVNKGSGQSIMTLSTIEGNKYTWLNSLDEKIVTLNGRIIETKGFEKNMLLTTCKSSSRLRDFCDGYYEDQSDVSQTVFFSNPKALIDINSSIHNEEVQSPTIIHNHKIKLAKENFSADLINWKGVNYFWFDPNDDMPIKTIQYTHPMVEAIEIEFYFIYE
tara:strand:+ start:860 stop:1510 length:651 start_codon:yes stop_codon:yes gene_type:complete